MDEQNRIREAWERMVSLLSRRPGAARGTSITTVRLRSGLRCTVEEGSWQMTADQPAEYGGNDAGPGPGFYGRGALGLCAAQGYAMALARHGLQHRGIEVRIESDMDARGCYGLADDVPIGYGAMRCIVTVDSDAAEAAILAALDEADRLSPWRYNFTMALPVARQVTLRHQDPEGVTNTA
jgi:uncharacterized OsmC-like protein